MRRQAIFLWMGGGRALAGGAANRRSAFGNIRQSLRRTLAYGPLSMKSSRLSAEDQAIRATIPWGNPKAVEKSYTGREEIAHTVLPPPAALRPAGRFGSDSGSVVGGRVRLFLDARVDAGQFIDNASRQQPA